MESRRVLESPTFGRLRWQRVVIGVELFVVAVNPHLLGARLRLRNDRPFDVLSAQLAYLDRAEPIERRVGDRQRLGARPSLIEKEGKHTPDVRRTLLAGLRLRYRHHATA